MTKLEEMGARAKEASRVLLTAGSKKTETLVNISKQLRLSAQEIISENAKDIEYARANGMTEVMVDRLRLSTDRIDDMADALLKLSSEPEVVGRVLSGETRPNGLKIEKVTVPLGVIGIIYESRPNVTSDAAGLCLKSGNAVILRGGKDAINSNKAITAAIRNGLEGSGLPADSVQLVEDTSRQSSVELMGLIDYLDVLIPRGGGGLIRSVKENSKVPVIETGVGNCHIYVDKYADLEMAADIIFNAKTSRPSVCNTIETILVHKDVAQKALPLIKKKLDAKDVEIRGDEKTLAIIPEAVPAVESDWYEEFLSYTLACKVVSSEAEAISHIAKYSSRHSEAIITDSQSRAERFLNEVDSAAVYVNASTRFTDGGEFGLGAEIGISTQKLHARGPMGLAELVSYKYIIRGNGQIR